MNRKARVIHICKMLSCNSNRKILNPSLLIVQIINILSFYRLSNYFLHHIHKPKEIPLVNNYDLKSKGAFVVRRSIGARSRVPPLPKYTRFARESLVFLDAM